MHAAIEGRPPRTRPDLTRMLARVGATVALVVGGSITGMSAATAAGSTPVAYDDFATTTAGQPVDIVLYGSDADVEPLTFAIASAPTSGTLGAIGSPVCDTFGDCTATVTYTPPAASGAVDSFTFTVSDGTLTSPPATVDITVEAPPPGSITSAGPLTRITTTADLNCAVNHAGDQSGEWFDGTACGTLVAVGTSLYGPSSIPAGGGATGSPGYQAFTPVSQTGPTGAGTQASPYVLTTVVDLPGNGMRLTQTDSYVVGQESYRTDLALASTDGAAHTAIVYRAGDCYLQDSDLGLGQVFSGNSPNCKAKPDAPDPNRVEGFFPLTGPSHYMEAGFSEVWAAVGTKAQLPDTCRCAENIDNGIALSWPAAIAAAGTTTISSLTNFSPVGAVPVSLSKTADDSEVAAGSADGYTVTVTNPGAVPQTLTSITDTLPVGFTYVAGSSTGLTTADPTVSGRDVTWTGTFTVPAATGGTPGTRTLHFGVTVSPDPGTYTNSVAGSGSGVTVLGATAVAPVTVTAADTTPPDTTITAGPTGTTTDSTPTFSFTSTEAGSTFQCRVDGGAWVSCTSPHTTAALADGAHTFEVRATDAAGNTDATPASRTFTVDATPPDTTITDGPTGTTTDATPTFSFTSTEAGSTFQCRMDGGAWASCTSPHTTAGLADGAHTFEVRATDAAGNTDATPASRTFTVATPAPVPTCFGKPATVVGTAGNDVLTGTGGDDVIVGLGGKDRISGGGGDDLICGGDGDDVLRGAAGDDRVDGGTGNDDIGGGGGDDVLLGDDGDDRMKGNGGDDAMDGGAGDDQLRGAGGDDDLAGGPGDDRLYGQGGDDHLSGGPGRDKLDGGPGRDRGDGGGGQDVIVRCET